MLSGSLGQLEFESDFPALDSIGETDSSDGDVVVDGQQIGSKTHRSGSPLPALVRKEEADGVDLQRGFSGKMTLMADDGVVNAPLGPWPLLLRWVRDAQATAPLHHVCRNVAPCPQPCCSC